MYFTVFNSYDFVIFNDGIAPLRCLFSIGKNEYRERNSEDSDTEDEEDDDEIRI